MIAIDVLGNPAWLLPYGPNTAEALTIKPRVGLRRIRSKTGRSLRRPTAYLLRHDLSWRAQMTAEQFRAARAVSLSPANQLVVTPFWVAQRAADEASVMTSGVTIAWTEDWSSYEINPASLAAYDWQAPLLVGKFKQPPRLISVTDGYVLASISMGEQGDASFAMVPPVEADSTLATPDGYAAPVFPFVPELSKAPELGLPDVDVDRQALGPGRVPSEAYYPQAAEMAQTLSFRFNSAAEIIRLLGWWQRRAGGADVVWIPTSQSLGELSADLPAGSTAIATESAMSVAIGDTLALCTTGQAPEFVRVANIVLGVPQLAGPTAADHPKAWTTVVPALLATHSDSELTISAAPGSDDWLGAATLAFREAGAEYAVTDGETRGTTVGRAAGSALLLQVDLDYSGVPETTHLTNWESGVTTPDAIVWAYSDFSFDRLTQSIDLEDDVSTLRIRWAAGGPWENWLPGNLSATGKATLYSAPAASDGTIGAKSLIWSGTVEDISPDGAIVSVQLHGANAFFSSHAPHAQMTPDCWKAFCGAACTLQLTDWQFNGLVSSFASPALTVGTITRANGGGLPAGFGGADWFADGYVEWIEAGGRRHRSSVLTSTALAGGEIVLTVDRPLDWSAGDGVVLVPACDKKIDTCDTKYGNRINHGGFFDMPATDPSFKIPNTANTPAKK